MCRYGSGLTRSSFEAIRVCNALEKKVNRAQIRSRRQHRFRHCSQPELTIRQALRTTADCAVQDAVPHEKGSGQGDGEPVTVTP